MIGQTIVTSAHVVKMVAELAADTRFESAPATTHILRGRRLFSCGPAIVAAGDGSSSADATIVRVQWRALARVAGDDVYQAGFASRDELAEALGLTQPSDAVTVVEVEYPRLWSA